MCTWCILSPVLKIAAASHVFSLFRAFCLKSGQPRSFASTPWALLMCWTPCIWWMKSCEGGIPQQKISKGQGKSDEIWSLKSLLWENGWNGPYMSWFMKFMMIYLLKRLILHTLNNQRVIKRLITNELSRIIILYE